MNSYLYSEGEVPFKLIEATFDSYIKRLKKNPDFDLLKFKKVKLQENAEPIDFLSEIRKHENKLAESKKALEKCNGNLSAVATQLGITRQTLYNKMKKFGL